MTNRQRQLLVKFAGVEGNRPLTRAIGAALARIDHLEAALLAAARKELFSICVRENDLIGSTDVPIDCGDGGEHERNGA